MSSILYPTTNLQNTEELIIQGGSGVFVYDSKGRQYLEGMSGLWCTSLGWGNEELAEVAATEMRNLSYAHMFGGKSHPAAIQLADKLTSMVAIKDARVFFGSSGSDANDTQVKLLQYYYNGLGKPSKKRIIAREGAYHGVTWAASALTALPTTHAGFDVPERELGIIRVPCPHYYRQHLPGESEETFVTRLTDILEDNIVRLGSETIAAMIVEPVTGAGGVVVPPAGYFSRLQAVLEKHDILLWDDEVICGFGRTGNDFGATTFKLEPDMMSFAKGLSSGYLPISAAVISGTMYDAIEAASRESGIFGHGYTYSGHPVCCAVALRTLEIYERDRIFEKARETASYFQRRLKEFEQHPLVGEVRGVGMIAAIEMVADKHTGKSFDSPIGPLAQRTCQEHGLILRAVAGNSLAICPPLIIQEDEIDQLIHALRLSLDKTQDYVAKAAIT